MNIEKYVHKDVNKKGIVKSGGAVETKPFLRIGRANGCGLPDCHCSDGYWISIGFGLKKGVVEGVKVTFEDKEEMKRYL